MHEVLVNRLGGQSLPRKSVVRLTDRPDMTSDVYRGRKTTMQHNSLSSHPEMRKLDKTETLVTIGDMTYVREVTKLTCTVVCVYISNLTQFAYFLSL